MEFQEFCKLRNRMCRTIEIYDCILSGNCSTCEKHCIENPIKAERIVNMWTKEHPLITNMDKFREVFGENNKGFEATPEWWGQEYK